MAIAATVVLVVLVLMATYQAVGVLLFVRLLLRYEPDYPAHEDLPRVAVIMALRGADPFLAESLSCVLAQDYPDYDVHFVVDSETDPARDVVERAIRDCGANHAHVQVYRDERSCGPVNSTNSKIVQAARELDESYEVWVMADADLMAPPDWLRQLVGPLVNDARLGATFGNRWFIPSEGQWGSLVRYVWNAAAVVGMHFLSIPWGGCFALRASAARHGNLVERWSRIIAFDAASPRDLRQQGLELRFVPTLMMLNREECSLPFAQNFVRRQLTWTRLYHGRWAGVVFQAVTTVACVVGSFGLLAGSVLLGDSLTSLLALAGFFVFLLSRLVYLGLLELAVRKVVRRRGERLRWLTAGHVAKLIPVIFLAHFVQVIAVLLGTFVRRVKWRGLVLEVKGPEDIRLVRTANSSLSAGGSRTSI